MKIRKWLTSLISPRYNEYYNYHKGGVRRSLTNLTDLSIDAEQSQEIVVPRPNQEDSKNN